MELIDKAKAIEKIKKKQDGFAVDLSLVQLAVYEGLLIAEDIVRNIPEVPKFDTHEISYDRLFFLAKKMHRWIEEHSYDEKIEYNKIGFTDRENKLLEYDGWLTISAIDGKKKEKRKR